MQVQVLFSRLRRGNMNDLFVTFKTGNATLGVYRKGNKVWKHFRTQSKFERELSAYAHLTDCPFVPKILEIVPERKFIVFPYVGESLNLKYRPKDRHVFKPQIRRMNEILYTDYGVHHNDIRWKNVVENDDGYLFLIDFEMWTPLTVGSKERDPERIL